MSQRVREFVALWKGKARGAFGRSLCAGGRGGAGNGMGGGAPDTCSGQRWS